MAGGVSQGEGPEFKPQYPHSPPTHPHKDMFLSFLTEKHRNSQVEMIFYSSPGQGSQRLNSVFYIRANETVTVRHMKTSQDKTAFKMKGLTGSMLSSSFHSLLYCCEMKIGITQPCGFGVGWEGWSIL
jgi:hypothetical protein